MFKVGQTVWCVLYGKGQVVEVDSDSPYPVRVQFVDGYDATYTVGGHYHQQFQRTLFFSEPVITAETEPPFIPTLKHGEVVVVTDRQTGVCDIY